MHLWGHGIWVGKQWRMQRIAVAALGGPCCTQGGWLGACGCAWAMALTSPAKQ